MVREGEGLVVALDPEADSDVVLRAAVDIASGMGLSLVAASAFSDGYVDAARQNRPDEGAFVDLILSDAEATMAARIVPLAPGVHVECVALQGDPGPGVHSLASRMRARLLVVGMRNRSRVGKLLLGSTTQQLLLGSSIPVVAVPVG